MSLTWGTIDVLNFAHGSIFMFSAFTSFLILNAVKLPFIPVLIICVVAGAIMSVIVEFLVFQPILRRARDRSKMELQILAAGIGVAGIPVAIAQRLSGNEGEFGFSGSTTTFPGFTVLGIRISAITIIMIVAAVVIGIALSLWLGRSMSGLAVRSVGVSPETASLMGVNRGGIGLIVFIVAGALAGLAGCLLTYYLGAIQPDSGNTLIVKAFAIAVLGGVGSMGGAVIGSLILAAAETVVLVLGANQWVDAVSFLLIFVILLVRPRGLFGKKEVRRT
jgi:branched-chain amino acid transport system permease protein